MKTYYKYLFIVILTISAFANNLSGIHPYRKALMDSVDYTRMWENLKILTGESETDLYSYIPSRHAHHPDFAIATDFIATKFIEMGYEPVLDSFDIGIDIFALDLTDGIISASGRHSVLRGYPSENLASSELCKCPFIQDVAFPSPDTGYAIGIRESMEGSYLSYFYQYTPDTGWEILRADSTMPVYAFDFATPDIAFLAKLDGTVIKYIRSEGTFTEYDAGTYGFYDIDFKDAMTGAACGAGGSMVYTQNGGESWNEYTPALGSTFFTCSFNQYGNVIIAGKDGQMYRFDPESEFFTPVLLSTSADINDVEFNEGGPGYFVTSDGKLFVTYDGGDIWAVRWEMPESGELGFDNVLNAVEVDYENIYIAGERSIYLYSSDSGWNFDRVPTVDQWANVFVDIDAHPGWFSDTVFGMTAHYDAVSENPFMRAPGANDNGTGTVIIMEAARLLQNQTLRHGARFILCAGEEVGLTGSMHHRRITTDINWGAIVNVDQVGYPSTEAIPKIKVNGDWGDESIELAFRLIEAIDKYASPIIALPTSASSTLYSDHYPFQEAGIPAVTMEEYTRTPFYHTTGDTVGNIDSLQFYHSAKAAIASMIELCYPVANMTGRVADGLTDEPIAGATVELMGQTFTTDSSGMFFFTHLPRAETLMTATATDYDTLELDVYVSGGVIEMWYDMYIFPHGERVQDIRISNAIMDDDDEGTSYGDGDGFVDAGERVEFTTTVFSTRPWHINEVTGRIRNLSGEAVLVDSIVDFEDMEPYDRVSNNEPFKIRANYAFGIYDELEFDIIIFSNEDSLTSRHFSFGGESILENPIIQRESSIDIYPNPTRGNISISSSKTEQLYLYNIRGQQLGTISGNATNVNLHRLVGRKLEPGIYLIKSDTRNEIAKKIILID